MKQPVSFLESLFRGRIGKDYVIKWYKYGKIKTKYPDMSRIVASEKQRKARDLFKEAVSYAKKIIADPEVKRAWQKRIRTPNGVYNAAIKYYMLKDKKAKEAAIAEANRLLRLALRNEVAASSLTRPQATIVNPLLITDKKINYSPIKAKQWQTTKTKPAGKTASG